MTPLSAFRSITLAPVPDGPSSDDGGVLALLAIMA